MPISFIGPSMDSTAWTAMEQQVAQLVTNVGTLQSIMNARQVRILAPRTSLLLALNATVDFTASDWNFPDDTYQVFKSEEALLGNGTVSILNKTAAGLTARLKGTAGLGLAVGSQFHIVAWC